MASELQRFFEGLHYAVSTGIPQQWADAVDELLVEPIRAAAPEGKTDHLKQSVRKVQGALTGDGELRLANGNGESAGITQWVVMAGGPLTTKTIIHPNGAMQEYDYALGTEFGTRHEPAEPFFWNTVRAQWPRLMVRAEKIFHDFFAHMGGSQ